MNKLSDNPFVCVIVNTIDRPLDLKRCLEAVLGQSYQHFEVVVVNNGVGEETRQLLEEMKIKYQISNIKFRVIEDKTKRLSYLFNVGWKNASPNAEIFAYAADDTEPDKDWLVNIADYLKIHPECGGISGPTLSTTQPPGEMFALYEMMKKNVFTRLILRLYEYFVMEDKTFAPGYWPQSGAFTMGAGIPLPQIKEPVAIDLLTSGNMGITREAMVTISGFDENFYFNHADGDLFIRLKKAGFRLVFHPAVKVLHHMRFGPTRYPEIMGRDTAFYYLKDVRPRSLRGWIGFSMNLGVFLTYWIFKAYQTKNKKQLNGLIGFVRGIYDFFTSASPERNELIKTLTVAAGFIFLMTQAFRNLHLSGMLAYGDATPFPFSAGQAFRTFFSAWDYRSPGIFMPQIPVLTSLTFFEGILISLFLGNAVAAQWLFHWLPIPLTFITFYYLLSTFSISRPAKFFASFLYSANLVAVGEVTGGFEGSLYVQAFFPLLLLFMYEFAHSVHFNTQSLLKFAALLSLAYLLSDHVFLFLLPFALVMGLMMMRRRRIVAFLLFWLGSAVLVTLLTFFHTYYYFSLAFPFLSGGIRPDVLKFLFQNVHDTFNSVTLNSALKVGSYYYRNLFGGGTWWERAGLVLPIVSLSWFIFPANRRKPRIFYGLLFSVLVVLSVFFLVRARENLNDLFLRFPILFRFRNPARPWLFLTLTYAFLSALTIDGGRRLVERGFFRLTKNLRFGLFYGLYFTILAVLFFYYFPFFSGDFTMGKNRGNQAVITPRYREIGDWLSARHEKHDAFRTLWLPYNHEETEVKLYWLDPYAFAVPINYGAYTRSSYLTNLTGIYRDLAAERLEDMPLKLAQSGVKYIILNTASKEIGRARYSEDYQTPWLSGVWGDWKRIINDEPQFHLLGEVGSFRIFENSVFDPRLVDSTKAGLPPEDGGRGLLVRSVVIFISFLAWGILLGFWLWLGRRPRSDPPQ